jgi:hypothetical protein
MTNLKHTAHIKQPHRSNPQKKGVRTSEQLVAIVVMPKFRRGPAKIAGVSNANIKVSPEYKAWKKLPITIERGSKTKHGLKGPFQVPETDGEMLGRANDEMMKHHVDSTWLKFKRKKKVHQLYKTQ